MDACLRDDSSFRELSPNPFQSLMDVMDHDDSVMDHDDSASVEPITSTPSDDREGGDRGANGDCSQTLDSSLTDDQLVMIANVCELAHAAQRDAIPDGGQDSRNVHMQAEEEKPGTSHQDGSDIADMDPSPLSGTPACLNATEIVVLANLYLEDFADDISIPCAGDDAPLPCGQMIQDTPPTSPERNFVTESAKKRLERSLQSPAAAAPSPSSGPSTSSVQSQ